MSQCSATLRGHWKGVEVTQIGTMMQGTLPGIYFREGRDRHNEQSCPKRQEYIVHPLPEVTEQNN